jgi:uncharacterized protein (TIGR00730 family)
MAGGIGTLEELFEIWTWGQLGDHRKPIAMLNIDGFYDPLLAFLDGVVAAGFFRPQHRAMILVDDAPVPLIAKMQGYAAPDLGKWIKPAER